MSMRLPILAIFGALLMASPQQLGARQPSGGINLAGGEFNAGRRPGTYAKDYIYPNAATAKPFVAMGMKVVRVPVLWERLQPEAMQPLSSTEMARLDKALGGLNGFQLIIIDVHNYGKFQGKRLDQISGGGRYLADLWQRLAIYYKARPAIAFGLMNEPNGMAPAAWRKIADQSVAAIRRAGARNLILVPGSNWTGAHSWLSGGSRSNAAAFADFRDPGRNYVLEMHQYLDRYSSGMDMQCVTPDVARQRMTAATNWLRQNRHRGFLGEFGASTDAQCLKSLDALLAYVHGNGDVWLGWTYWAGGPWMGSNYPMSVQPVQGKARPQSTVLARYASMGEKSE
jgi:endoglucanase